MLMQRKLRPKHVSRTSNVYRPMSTETCRRRHVARSRYMLNVSRRHNYYSFMSRSIVSLCIQQQTGTGDNLATILLPIQDTMLTATSGYNLCPASLGPRTPWLRPWYQYAMVRPSSRKRMQQSKNVKSRFLDFEKNVKEITCKVLETTQSVFSVSIKLLIPYFNQQFYMYLFQSARKCKLAF